MTEHQTVPHENVNALVEKLDHAIHELLGTRTVWLDGKLTTRMSRQDEIWAISDGETGNGNSSRQRSKAPIWIEAWAWIQDVGRTLANAKPPRGKWTPLDITRLHNHITDVRELVARADQLLDEQDHNFELVAACPACGERTVYRQDAGETVRRAALTVTTLGCVCLACHAKWSPEYFVHLSRVIGCGLPTGVLE